MNYSFTNHLIILRVRTKIQFPLALNTLTEIDPDLRHLFTTTFDKLINLVSHYII